MVKGRFAVIPRGLPRVLYTVSKPQSRLVFGVVVEGPYIPCATRREVSLLGQRSLGIQYAPIEACASCVSRPCALPCGPYMCTKLPPCKAAPTDIEVTVVTGKRASSDNTKAARPSPLCSPNSTAEQRNQHLRTIGTERMTQVRGEGQRKKSQNLPG